MGRSSMSPSPVHEKGNNQFQSKPESIASNNPSVSNEPEQNNFIQGFNKRLSFFKTGSMKILDEVSAASIVAREKATVMAGTGMQIASQKYTEFLEERPKHVNATHKPGSASSQSGSTFTIDDEDDISGFNDMSEDKDGDVDPNKIAVSRTDLEKAYALAMHALSGLRVGDSLVISKDNLPGATLFPCVMYVSKSGTPEAGTDDFEDSSAPEHRFLIVTKERFLVVDTKGGGVSSTGTVDINKHLTEVTKLFHVNTFVNDLVVVKADEDDFQEEDSRPY
jgi:hypothetical protein